MLSFLKTRKVLLSFVFFILIIFIIPDEKNDNSFQGFKSFKIDEKKYPAEKIDGFLSYAPHFAYSSEGFNAEFFDILAKNEENHFWFVKRNEIIIDFLKKVKDFHSFLEIGCGTGYVLKGVSEIFPDVEFAGAEIFTNGLYHAQKRLKGVTLLQMDATNMPFVEEFDVIGAFDVLEHIKEDEKVLLNIYKSLKKGGNLILTVPQHMWLWSKVDEYACHERRYTKQELIEKLEKSGFKIIKTSSFVTTLVPFMYLSRLFDKDNKDASSEFNLNPFLNKIFKIFLSFEKILIDIGIDLPIGGSRIVLAEKI